MSEALEAGVGRCDLTFDRLYVDRSSGRVRVMVDGRLVYRYRVVMERHLARPLNPGEHVHHINGDTADDRLANLEVLGSDSHGALHGRKAWQDRKARWKHAWSEHYASCVDCGSTEQPHQAHGLCRRCSARERQQRYRDRKAAA